ncbi:hypothetical protein P2Q02_08565 [Bacillus pumilus]|nr:hypothetical protein [Bacillus pumilus]MDF2002711.1 hypothetical protein [Bacillus pumilus]MDF2025701.1 hypothetical protein [Bacillus pumilus]MDF2027593.1 hypothetical protein [Bacillus pumilus]MDF2090587.1 hypothetical protein [Bacillus pumilus]
MKIKKGKHSLDVTERAFEVIYKDLGYKPDKKSEKQEQDGVEEVPEELEA